jgi:hypothetical protein
MSTTTSVPAADPQSGPIDLHAIEHAVSTSKTFAWALVLGLPILGLIAALLLALPLFAALLAGSFLLATALVSHKAISTFTGKALRLLVTARLVLILVLGALLFFTSGSAWMAIVSAVLLWLTADRLLGRRALYDLWKLSRSED